MKVSSLLSIEKGIGIIITLILQPTIPPTIGNSNRPLQRLESTPQLPQCIPAHLEALRRRQPPVVESTHTQTLQPTPPSPSLTRSAAPCNRCGPLRARSAPPSIRSRAHSPRCDSAAPIIAACPSWG
ncbi:predicted protein [Chaetomium globosum CBS 148.51]|uniref:Uncharacterized protein n=1 Tax=Chaetomium globosum (strain ATCC 6205 / CBS 148.51 / DSM 1962 / NBRC 6347 / NRRL 1970) TaxID=306901 RepID=Q2H2L0_CHAGB|nr:uncharacterized protein CHGG_03986 [Chaetomium globosum CBS 148.51]EAQ87367.1 predicted protein [Chaetomium globosum CBS 148.51]